MSISVDVMRDKRFYALRLRPLKSLVRYILNKEGVQTGEVSVLITDDNSIQDLNHRYREKNAPTDVLSFPFGQNGQNLPMNHLGDIVISWETAKRQAKTDSQSEVEYLLVHGLLHLIGYRDSTEEEHRIMLNRQDDIFNEWKTIRGG